jgi:hypothetical protein
MAKRNREEEQKMLMVREPNGFRPLDGISVKAVTGHYPAGQVFHFKNARARATAILHAPELADKLDDSEAVTEAAKAGKIPHALVVPVNVRQAVKLKMPRGAKPTTEDILRQRIGAAR